MPDGSFTAAELAAVSARLGRDIVGTRLLTGGYRNVNVLATAGPDRYVLRRCADPAACAVEAAVAVRLRDTAVPVPEVVLADPGGALLGDPLLVSRFAPGTPGDRVLATGDAADALGLARAMGETLAAVGAVRFAEPGFLGADLVPTGGPVATGLVAYAERELAGGNAGATFDDAELAALHALVAREAHLVETVAGQAHLVHGDYNPKNVLAEPAGGGWRISAVLDWEFALAATPLFDVGNALRFAAERPAGFEPAFTAGYERAGGTLPPDWRRISRAVDLFALIQFLSRPPEHRYFRKSVTLLRDRL
ncbi:MAG TPA: phosphotransferase [Actinocatenispora sp.]